MRASSFFSLILFPALVALGHDAYLFYINIIEPKGFTLDLLLTEFKFSSLGYIWTSYDEAGFKLALESTDKETWANIDYILTFTALYVALGFAGAMATLFGLLGVLFGIGPLKIENSRIFHASDSKSDTSFRSGQQSKKFDYKRK